MKNLKNILLKSLPTLVAIFTFGVVAIVGFAPQLEGRVLPQHDIRQFDGMSRDIRECRAEFDEDPQWTGAMFSGMPAYQINIKYPSQIIKRSVDWVQSLFAEPASMIFFAMLSAFVMSSSLNSQRSPIANRLLPKVMISLRSLWSKLNSATSYY